MRHKDREYHISVRELVEFILRSGDLDERKGIPDQEAMQKGSRLHQKLQKSAGDGYQAEVSLKRRIVYDDLVLFVEGRADGIFMEDIPWIDEIKGMYFDVGQMQEPVGIHKAQAMCYACMIGEERSFSKVGIQMTYVNLDTEFVRRFREEIEISDLKEWFRSVTDSFHEWISFRQEWMGIRDDSIRNLTFPFAYREGQKTMVRGVYQSIRAGRQIFIQAPTGVGKTLSTVFPSVWAVGEGKASTIFYLTAKTITRTVAQEAFDILADKGLKYKVITLTAKEKLCPGGEVHCTPDACSFARGHFDRVNEAVFSLLKEEKSYTREVILEAAIAHRVCPFEMALDLSLWCDAVICDYNYAFAPDVSLKRFFGEGIKEDYIFLIDEAHNLVERGREMFSASLLREDVMAARRMAENEAPSLMKTLSRVSGDMLVMKRELREDQGKGFRLADGLPLDFTLHLQKVRSQIEMLMEEGKKPELTENLLEFYFKLRRFLNVLELVDEHYVIYQELDENQSFLLRLLCVNPANNLKKRLQMARSAVFFSATFLPLLYYRHLLSVREDDHGVYIPSPFDPGRRLILAACDVSSRYTRRGYEEYLKIAEYIYRTAKAKAGNYLVFFPSYAMLDEVLGIYQENFSREGTRMVSQQPSMKEEDREAFLAAFSEASLPGSETLIGFVVLGGFFSEGIDLPGKSLIGAVIVGTGLPQISHEREVLKGYFDRRGEDGFAIAYRYPGMNKVLQAAGRVIRTKEDRGVIVLLDERFGESANRILFPREWKDVKRCRLKEVDRLLTDFWCSQQ